MSKNTDLLQSQLEQFISPDVIVTRAKGVHIETESGTKLLDLSSGYWLVSLGYGNEEIIDAMARAATELSYSHLYRYAHRPALELAAKLLSLARPADFNKVLFGNSGSEAMEIAIHLVMRFAELRKISNPQLAYLRRGYAGSTFLEQCLTSFRHYPATLSLDREFFPLTSPLDDDHARQSLQELEELANTESLVGLICEPIQGVGGVIVPPDWYFPEVRKICDAHSVLLVFDEASTGMGVTGKWFGFKSVGATPDILALAKRLGGGYFPISAVLAHSRLSEIFEKDFEYGHTTSGHPVGCKVASKIIEIVERDNLLHHINQLGTVVRTRLVDEFVPIFGEHSVSGRGLMLSIRTSDSDSARAIQCEARKRGVHFHTEGRFIVICPPFIITEGEIQHGIDCLVDATNSVVDRR